jgi:predicted  nucleic acid-binding Zn-ribbon protein
MEASLAKFETSRVRLELQTITSKLENEQKRCELLERDKANIHLELNDTRVKLERMQQEYVEAKKDQARPLQSETLHRELSDHITRLSEQNKGLHSELIGYKDQCLVLQTKLSDA